MTEEGSAPDPPDIRPFGRHYQRNTLHSPHDGLIVATGDRAQTRIRRHNHNNLHTLCYLSLFALVIASLPAASAQHVAPQDPYTSLPIPTKATPILTLLGSIFHHVLNTLSYLIGHDLSAQLSENVHHVKRLDTTGIVEACMIPLLVVLSGIFAGLTLGYFSVDQTQLQVLSISGTPKQQEYARKIIPVRKDSHLLLTSLILGNMIVNEALPVVTDGVITNGVAAVVMSTALVVIFAEIIPQSVCSRYGLLIGAKMAFPVRCLIYLAFPIAWPIAKLLQYILGAHHGIIYRRSELRELIKMHAAGAEGGGDLDFDTVTMAQGALDLAGKTVTQAMTPIDQVFMLPIEAKLDYETLGHVVRSGHSRVPVYQMVEIPDVDLTGPALGPTKTKLVKKVLGSLLVKSCVLLDPEDATPLATIPINAIPSVPCDEPLTNMLNVFQEGRSHMAIVSRRPRRREIMEDAESVMTAAAGGLRQRFMRKVAEITHGDKSVSNSSGSDGTLTSASESEGDAERGEAKKKKRVKKAEKGHHHNKKEATEAERIKVEVEKQKQHELEQQKQIEAEKKKGFGALGTKLTQLEQVVPSDAQMPPAMMEKFFEGLEGAPLGIITLEDVLEELIGEEIYDEYDEHGGPRNAASAFIPREAALAARKAAMDREKAIAQATPLPNDNDLETDSQNQVRPESQSVPVPSKRIVPKLPLNMSMSKFGLGRRPASQPGRSRTEGSSNPAVAASTATPTIEKKDFGLTPTSAGGEVKRSESPSQMDDRDDSPPVRSASDKGLALRRNSAPRDASVSPALGMTSLDPVSAVPPRLLPGAAPSPPNALPANTALLTEALLIERGRRRAGLPGGAGSRPSSVVPTSRSAVPSRQTTPPAGIQPTGGVQPKSTESAGPPGVLSPIPVVAPKRGKFKSVPTPVATPRITSANIENPLDRSASAKGE